MTAAPRAPLHPDFLRLPVAHRAYHDRAAGRPENSRAAIRTAVAAGYAIEIDLQPSADGRAMVFHDYDLRRLTGADGMIRQHSAADLAGLTLLGGDLTGIVRARKLARATMRNIRQNLFFAFAYNTAGIPVAAGLLYPFFGILLSPMIAAAAMSLSSVSVIANALRLKRVKL